MSSKLIVDTIEDSTGTYSLALGSGNSTFPGGIHLGGTGSANLLADYEEGTWTPVSQYNGFTQSIGYFDQATYVKIGKIVHCTFSINFGTAAYGSAYSYVTGLPFTASSGTDSVNGFYSSGSISANARGGPIFIGASTNGIYLFVGSNTVTSTVWDVGFTYKTDS